MKNIKIILPTQIGFNPFLINTFNKGKISKKDIIESPIDKILTSKAQRINIPNSRISSPPVFFLLFSFLITL